MIPELENSVHANYPLISFVTHEEIRALDLIKQFVEPRRGRSGYDLYVWSFTKGFRVYAPQVEDNDLVTLETAKQMNIPVTLQDPCIGNVTGALKTIHDYQGRKTNSDVRTAVFVLLDFHPFLEIPEMRRRLRDIVEATHRGNGVQSTIMLSPVLVIPEELAKSTAVIDLPLPSAAVLRSMIDDIVATLNAERAADKKSKSKDDKPIVCPDDVREEIVKSAAGLTLEEALTALKKGLQASQNVFNDIVAMHVREEKKQLIRKDGVLEYVSTGETMANVGGLTRLKPWIADRRDAFGEAAREYGLPAPKGVLLAGIAGCGKSLVAKAIASEWKLPLLRLDMGRIFSPMVGSSEAAARRVIKVAEATAPVVLWIDEIDKGFAGSSSSDVTDGGVTARVIGTLLTWMQEKNAPVFVIATANNVVDENGVPKLPPELLRKGRFDEMFFVDLPKKSERREIWNVHLAKRKRDPQSIGLDITDLVSRTDGFSGAEIEQVIIDALYLAFAEKGPDGKPRDLRQGDLERVITETHPLSQFAGERIEKLRAFAAVRMRTANGEEVQETLGDVAQGAARRSSLVGTRINGRVRRVSDGDSD